MKPRPDPHSVDSFLPLQPYEFQVLMVLSENDLHGYGIRRATLERTDGKLRLDPGVLYRTLRRLKDAGLIEAAGQLPAHNLVDQRRRYYSLTNLGGRVATAEADRLEALIAIGRGGKMLRDKGSA